jgi:sporulation protein YlmC with PRC-barrel domain
MVGFTAKLELPRFIPKEQILGKHVFDSELTHMGVANDWTYSFDGQVGIIVNMKKGKRKSSTAFVPLSKIDRVGEFILLKTKREKFIEDAKDLEYERNVKKRQKSKDEKERKRDRLNKNGQKQADELDFERLDAILLKKRKKSMEDAEKAVDERDAGDVRKGKKRKDEKKRKKERPKSEGAKYADELDFESLEAILLKK